MAILISIVFVCLVVRAMLSVANSAAAVHNIRKDREEWIKIANENRDKNLDTVAKQRNVYYNRVIHVLEHDRNYDGTPKKK